MGKEGYNPRGRASTGCSINYKVAGSFENANEVFRGDINHNLLFG